MRPIRPRRPLPSLIAIIALVAIPSAITSCSGSGTSRSDDAPTELMATIRIVDGQFDPREVEIAVGGSVQWINDDVNPHQLISLAVGELASPVLATGQTWTRQFTAPGEVRYYDAFRATMKGSVIVR